MRNLLPHRAAPGRKGSPAQRLRAFTALWLQQRRRRRAASAVVPIVPLAPNAVGDLVLWLDASLGVLRAWDAPPASGFGSILYGSGGYTAYGYTHALRVYPFKTVGAERVYSATALELQTGDDNSEGPYQIGWTWDAVADAEGYRVLKSDGANGFAFDYYADVPTNAFTEDGAAGFTSGSTITPLGAEDAGPGDPVALWRDQSGLGHDAAQFNTALRPTLQWIGEDNWPAVRFDAVDDGMATPTALNGPLTVLAVYAFAQETVAPWRAVQGENNWLLGPYALKYDFFNGSDFTSGPATTVGRIVVQSIWQDASVSHNYINGELVGTVNGAGVYPGLLGLGCVGSFAEPMGGDLIEVIAYNRALSDAERGGVELHLLDKYGLT